MEGPVGLEPTTRGLKGHCSNQLSYGPGLPGRANRYIIAFFDKNVNIFSKYFVV